MPRTLVLADLHLTTDAPAKVTDDLARLVSLHPGARLIFAGDLFDMSAESRRPRPTLSDALSAHPKVRAALGEHVSKGGELWLVSGNHDGEIGTDDFGATLSSALELHGEARSRVRTTPWFFREGAVHIEHGHLYDPDNAPAHPLAAGTSLGVHFVEQFLAPTGAFAYLNANDGTPLKLFLSSFRLYGLRAPHVIYRFFHASFTGLAKSGPFFPASRERPLGEARVAPFAASAGVERSTIDELIELAATPTLASMGGTFARLYLDRVFATIAMGAGVSAAVLGQPAIGAGSAALGALVMAASWSRGHDRYNGKVTEILAASAARVAEATSAKLVIFGHTHREAQIGAYANTGSFSFPRDAEGRPFLEIEGDWNAPRAVRRHLIPAT